MGAPLVPSRHWFDVVVTERGNGAPIVTVYACVPFWRGIACIRHLDRERDITLLRGRRAAIVAVALFRGQNKTRGEGADTHTPGKWPQSVTGREDLVVQRTHITVWKRAGANGRCGWQI